MEETSAGAPVLQVSASDADDGENSRVTYSLVTQAGFYIHPNTGVQLHPKHSK